MDRADPASDPVRSRHRWRQLKTEAGVLDLLGIDPQGRWSVIEIKRGTLSREAIAQALDYASLLASIDPEELRALTDNYLAPRGTSIEKVLRERDALDSLAAQDRELSVVIVGTGRAPGLDRMVQYLADRYGVPMSVVTLDVFKLSDGTQLLSRAVLEAEHVVESEQRRTRIAPEDVIALARENGLGQSFEAIHDAAIAHGLYPRTWKTSIMYASPKKRSQMLFTVWAKRFEERLRIYVGHQTFNEFYDVAVEDVATCLGPEGYRLLTPSEALEFVEQIHSLFRIIESAQRQPQDAAVDQTPSSGTVTRVQENAGQQAGTSVRRAAELGR